MVKKSFLLFILFVFLTSGCTLVKGTTGFAQGAKEGFKEDAKAVNAADAWVKENLW
ncbi:MAG: hypothetical protein NTX01_01360 [Candidatus Omnitrophica bacterium]|nr:hypothetical protein [Candidatus Omnitrophota bacterium]